MADNDTPINPEKDTWSVFRQDDNGNRFVVQEHISRDDAERLVEKFEARGHKQLYWADRDRETGSR
jgi:hypothetical protein